jgi:hypothetical protein
MAKLASFVRATALLLLGGLALLPVARAQAPVARETQVKAVFLFNFVQFVEWPAAAFASPDAPLVIGVLGADPFGEILDEVVRGEKIGARTLEVRRFATVEEVAGCQLLFISASEQPHLEETLRALQGRPILTVGDTEGFATRGGMIRFVTDRGRIKLRINLAAAKAAGLVLSSKLLRPAEIVGGEAATP